MCVFFYFGVSVIVKDGEQFSWVSGSVTSGICVRLILLVSIASVKFAIRIG